jgi:glycosyltransferase involved in cell wall biosynthesis
VLFRSIIEELGQAVTVAGRYEPSEVLPLMQSVGWVVVPSIWWENSPVVIQEARRAGTPLIVSDIGGMAEKVVAGRDGLHFRRGSVTDLAQTLLQASKPAVRAQFATSIKDVVNREDFLEGLARCYNGQEGVAASRPAIAMS